MNRFSRRVFLTGTGSLVCGFVFPACGNAQGNREGAVSVPDRENPSLSYENAFIRIEPDNRIGFILPNVEFGQGIHTAAVIILMEELEVDFDQVRVETGFSDEKGFDYSRYAMDVTLGSGSVSKDWLPLRQAAAALRMMLLQAAARQFLVEARQCATRHGRVYGPDNNVVTYGELIARVATLPMPTEVVLKKKSEYRLIGQTWPRIDTEAKLTGQARYGMDVRVPGMKTGLMVFPFLRGRRISRFDDRQARQANGVIAILRSEYGVCIIADYYWNALQAEKQLVLQWEDLGKPGVDTVLLDQKLQYGLKQDSQILYHNSQVPVTKALEQTDKQYTWLYQQSMQMHFALEPISCTVYFQNDRCEIWLGSQAPLAIQEKVAGAYHMDKEKIILHHNYIGGSFGRRLDQEYILQAVQFAKQVPYPLQCVWSREMDSIVDPVRTAYCDRIEVGVDRQGQLKTVRHKIVALENDAADGKVVVPDYLLGLDCMPYKIENYQLEWSGCQVPELSFGVGQGREATRNVFVLEDCVNRLAFLAKKDAIAYRKAIGLDERALKVVDLLMQNVEWGKPLPKGVRQGFAMAHVFGSYIAMVIEAEITATLTIHLRQVTAAVDCGLVINPDQVVAQIESGVVFGLGEALYGAVRIQQGRVIQRNYNQYRVLRMNESPAIKVYLVESMLSPSGVGELGTVVAAPALAHALGLIRGRFFDSLPLARQLSSGN